MPAMTMNAAAGRRTTLPSSPSTTSSSANTTSSRAYQPHRPGYHWEPAKSPPATNGQHQRQQQQPEHVVVDDDDDEDDFLQRIVHGSCQGVPACQGDKLTCHMADQLDLDLLMHCRQPLAFLSIFREHGDRGDILPPGAYSMHTTGCEYCGAPDTHQCDAKTCRRPALFFQKKRPPFAKADAARWDPVTEHAIERRTDTEHAVEERTATRPASPFEGSWVSGLFRKGRNESTTDSGTR